MMTTMLDPLLQGFAAIGTWSSLGWIVLGVFIGYTVGAIPGMGKGIATAISIPLTFYLSPIAAISYLIGIAKGSTAGSAVSAILINTPGEPSSAPTAMDGYPLARQGNAGKALRMGLYASVIGDLVSTMVLIGLAAPLARYALAIGPVEQFAILLFSLTFIGALASDSMIKGLMSGVLGILLATVGLEIETAVPRFTFGQLELYEGLSVIPLAIGMMATSEMVMQIARHAEIDAQTARVREVKVTDDRLTLEDWRVSGPAILRGTGIGVFIGILPGLGASVASFMSYGVTKKLSKTPERFGKGAIEGVAAAESADNAVIPASFIPLFALGIPGSVIAAILIAAFMIQGLTPDPLLFQQDAALVYGIYAAMIVASLVLLCIGLIGQSFFSKIVTVRVRLIVPVVLFFCLFGTLVQGGSTFAVWMMVAFTIIGFLFKKLGFSFVTFLIGFILGPSLELTLRQSLPLLNYDLVNLPDHPVAIVFIALAALTAAIVALRARKDAAKPSITLTQKNREELQ